MNVTESHSLASEPPFFRVFVRRASLVLYGAALAVLPLFGYSSILLFCTMVILLISALAFGARLRTVTVITAVGLITEVAVHALRPNLKGPYGIIPILRYKQEQAQRP